MGAYCKENSVLPEAWSPLIQGQAFKRELLIELAEKYKVDVYKRQVYSLPKNVPIGIDMLNVSFSAAISDTAREILL